VSADGVAPLKKKVEALLEHTRPQTVQDLQAFLSAVNFYRRFLPAAASLLQPLTDALRGEAWARDSLPWSTEMEAAFCSIKTALANAALLAHPTPGAEICLMVDASANHVGAALQQRPSPSSSWQPLGFFSKKLNPTQQCYSAFDRELLACTAGIRHFRHMLDGREFSILTDHKPITFALARATDAWTPRQSTPATSGTYPARRTWSPTPCPDLQPTPAPPDQLEPTPPDRIAASPPDQPAPTTPDRIAASPPDQSAPTPPDRIAVPGWRRPWPG
jgi:hypothetical protein